MEMKNLDIIIVAQMDAESLMCISCILRGIIMAMVRAEEIETIEFVLIEDYCTFKVQSDENRIARIQEFIENQYPGLCIFAHN